jgi:hypothetical protein
MPRTNWELCTATLSLRISSLLNVATQNFGFRPGQIESEVGPDEVTVTADAIGGPAEIELTMPGVVMGTAAS